MNTSHANTKVAKQKEHFETVSENYYEATQHPNCVEFNKYIWEWFLKQHVYILPKGAKMLEPMCGHGIARGYLAESLHSDFHYTGFDYSEPLVEIAKQRMPDSHIFLQDVTTFESQEEYDLIFLAGGLHHVYEQTESVLKRLYDGLAHGGYLLLAEPTYDNWLYGALGKIIYKNSNKFEHESEERYNLVDLNKSCKESGFQIIDQIYPGLMAYVIAVSAFCFPILCVGSPSVIRGLMRIEKPFYRSWLGKKLSFSTMTLLQKT